VLEDPKTNQKLYLIGTSHASTTLANRTKDLIKDIKPDTVFVQASEEWAERASHIKVSTQKEMTALNDEFFDLVYEKPYTINTRGLIFMYRYWTFMFLSRFYAQLPSSFHPFQPGLEIKNAIETGKEVGANIVYGGMAFDKINLEALAHEKRMDVPSFFFRLYFKDGLRRYEHEHVEQLATIDVQGAEAYAESLDDVSVSWWTQFLNRMAPRQKKILVNKKNKQLFFDLKNNCHGKNIVAVVNHWHLPQLEAMWRGSTGTLVNHQIINHLKKISLLFKKTISINLHFSDHNPRFHRNQLILSETLTLIS
jgi:pheromone shutdown protein TraB